LSLEGRETLGFDPAFPTIGSTAGVQILKDLDHESAVDLLAGADRRAKASPEIPLGIGGGASLAQGINFFDVKAVVRDLVAQGATTAFILPPKATGKSHWDDFATQALRILLHEDCPLEEVLLAKQATLGTTPHNLLFLNATICFSSMRPCVASVSLHEGVAMEKKEAGIDENYTSNLVVWRLRRPEKVTETWGPMGIFDYHEGDRSSNQSLLTLAGRVVGNNPLSVWFHSSSIWAMKAEAKEVDGDVSFAKQSFLTAAKGLLLKATFNTMEKLEKFLSGREAFTSWATTQDDPTPAAFAEYLRSQRRYMFRISELEGGHCYLVKPPKHLAEELGGCPSSVSEALGEMGIRVRGIVPQAVSQLMIAVESEFMSPHISKLQQEGWEVSDLQGRSMGDILMGKYKIRFFKQQREGHHIRVRNIPAGIPLPALKTLFGGWFEKEIKEIIMDTLSEGAETGDASVYLDLPPHPAVPRILHVPHWHPLSWTGEASTTDMDAEAVPVDSGTLDNEVARLTMASTTPIQALNGFKPDGLVVVRESIPVGKIDLDNLDAEVITQGYVQDLGLGNKVNLMLKEARAELEQAGRRLFDSPSRKAITFGRQLIRGENGKLQISDIIRPLPPGTSEVYEHLGANLSETICLVNKGSVDTYHSDLHDLAGIKGSTTMTLEGTGQVHFSLTAGGPANLTLKAPQGHVYHLPQACNKRLWHKTSSMKGTRISVTFFHINTAPRPEAGQTTPFVGVVGRNPRPREAVESGASPPKAKPKVGGIQ
jgi:hypothetical protein